MLNKYLLLDWIEDFHCVGAECPKTCCGTWNIALKETEIEKYRALAETHPFGRKICEAVDEERKCMRQKDRRCLLLTEEGWCRIVLECGEEYLSDTCTVFPRMMREFGDTLECLVEIACPVVAGRVLEDRSIGFGYEEIEAAAGEEAPPCDYALYDTLSLARTFLIELFQEYDASYSGAKIYILFSVIDAVKRMHGQDELDRNNMLALLQRWDSQSISNVQGTVYPLTERVELRAERILMLMGKLLSTVICVNGQKTNSDLLNLMLADVPGVSLQESILRWLEDREGFCRELEEFTAWFRREYPRAFENYFVYALFREFLPGDLDAERVGETFLVRVVLWSLIQLCAMSVWREGTLSRERYSMIICGLERISLHSSEIFDACIKILAEEKQTALLLLYLIY